jgi:amidohydrolase
MNWLNHPLYGWLQELRREFHMYPETAMRELRTTARVKEVLSQIGVEIIDYPGLESGVVAVLRGAEPGPAMAIRADMDALSLDEGNPVPYRSRNKGAMHACGHDAHTAILLGVAKKAVESGLTKRIKGEVKLFFQPGEENLSGAKAMIAAGVLQNHRPEIILTGHMDTELEVGKIGLYREVSHAASDRFILNVQGKGGHAGAPHFTSDPVVAACHIVLGLQSIVSRNLNPLDSAVISIGMIQAGSAPNIIPDRAEIRGSIRTFKRGTRDLVLNRLKTIAQNLGRGLGADVEVTVQEGVPPCRNHLQATQILQRAASEVIGEKNVLWPKTRTGSEDFALFAREIPGAVMRLGCRNQKEGIIHPAHSPRFDLDECVLPLGVDIFYRAIEEYLGGNSK